MNNIQVLSSRERLAHINRLVQEFEYSSMCCCAPFSILVYGSASYGLNKKKYGNLDDIDLFLIIPRTCPPEIIMRVAQDDVFKTDLSTSVEHLRALQEGFWDICRMYGNVDGTRIGFRIICEDIFLALPTQKGSVSTLKNVAVVGSSRIITDVEWSVTQWKYVPTQLAHYKFRSEKKDLLIVGHYIMPKQRDRLGALGRKLLASQVVYDYFGQAQKIIRDLWSMYTHCCFDNHPSLTSEMIIDSVYRSERFSDGFRDALDRVIFEVR